MSWCVTTQADNTIKVKLYDSVSTYINASRRNVEILPPLAISSSNVNGDNLKLYIESSGYHKLKYNLISYNIIGDNGATVGKIYDISIEDYTDNDYNDVCVSLIAWKNKG